MSQSFGDDSAIRFATQIFDLLDRTATTSTYKYAVLLGLLECCQRQVAHDGSAPDVVTTRQLAEAVTEIYWAQSKPFTLSEGVLRQNSGRQAKVLALIEAFRGETNGITSFQNARFIAPEGYEKLIRDVEWTLVKMPLPKLQRLGGTVYEFLYSIAWDDHITRSASGFSAYQRGDSSDFDNRILLKPGVGDFLVRLGPLLRPLIQREWSKTVASFNGLAIDKLEDFLFNQQRQDLGKLVLPLEQAQQGLCFYCDKRFGRVKEVDHFVPWSRAPNDELHNFVLAHRHCNGNKSNHLADVEHVRRWRARNDVDTREGRRFRDSVSSLRWFAEAPQTLSVARAVYSTVPDGMLLWSARNTFTEASSAAIEAVLS